MKMGNPLIEREENAMTDKNDDYEVGYGKPPKSTQFQKGQSGNPRGRPFKAQQDKALYEILGEVLNEPLPVYKNGEESVITKKEALIRKTIQRGLEGNIQATRMLLGYYERISKTPLEMKMQSMALRQPYDD